MRQRECVYSVLILNALAVAAAAGAPPLPRVITLSPQGMAAIKARIQSNDSSLKPAMDRLRRDADKALKAGPFSVMDKPRTPPSGDKHDYMSLAPYFWPDPTKKDGLPFINRDGEVNPENRKGTDSPPMGRMAASVQTLGLAYYLTDNERYAEHAAKLLRVWFLEPATRMNPNLNFGQGVPGLTAGRSSGIIDTSGLIGMLDGAGFLESYPGWTAADRQGMATWCKDYVHWLRSSKIGLQEAKATNNHGTWYDAQVAAMAIYCGDRQLAVQTIEASKHLRIDAQIRPDGSQPREFARTKSFHYSLYNLRALFFLAGVGDRVGVDLWHYRSEDGSSIQAAIDVVAPYADPERKWPHKELRYDRTALLPLLVQADVVYGGKRYKELLDLLPAQNVSADRTRLMYAR